MSTGRKEKQGKVPMILVPRLASIEVGRVAGFGMGKYGPYNWMLGLPWSDLISAQERHWDKWILGTRLDEESGIHHLAHSCMNTMMLLEYDLLGIGTDDRPPYNKLLGGERDGSEQE